MSAIPPNSGVLQFTIPNCVHRGTPLDGGRNPNVVRTNPTRASLISVGFSVEVKPTEVPQGWLKFVPEPKPDGRVLSRVVSVWSALPRLNLTKSEFVAFNK